MKKFSIQYLEEKFPETIGFWEKNGPNFINFPINEDILVAYCRDDYSFRKFHINDGFGIISDKDVSKIIRRYIKFRNFE